MKTVYKFILFFILQSMLCGQELIPACTVENHYSVGDSSPSAHYFEGQKCGFVNLQGKWIIKPIFKRVEEFSEGLAEVNYEGKIGYINTSGKFAISPQFTLATKFTNNRAYVYTGESSNYDWFLIDRDGKRVGEKYFDNSGKFIDGLSPNREADKDKWGYVGIDGESLIRYENDGKCGYISITGKIKIPAQYTNCYEFYNGFARVEDEAKTSKFINFDGKTINKMPKNMVFYGSSFEDHGYFIVRNGYSYGLLDYAGNIILPIEYEYIDANSKNGISTLIDGNDRSGMFIGKLKKVIYFEGN